MLWEAGGNSKLVVRPGDALCLRWELRVCCERVCSMGIDRCIARRLPKAESSRTRIGVEAREEGAHEGGVWEGCRGQRFGPRQAISSRNAILKISRTPRRWDASQEGGWMRGEHM